MATTGAALAEAYAPPESWEDDLRMLAFKTWQCASSPEAETNRDWLDAEVWCAANRL